MRPVGAPVRALVAALGLTLLWAAPAAAAPGTTKPERHPAVDTVSVSNPAPTRASTIDVFSAGWRPDGMVTISLASTELRRIRADATGAVHAAVRIPAGAPGGFGFLAVTGSSAAGLPQQVVTRVSVVVDHAHPASRRPWFAVSLVLALATLLLLASQRIETRKTRLAS